MGVSLGLVGIVDKGIYNPDETYNKGNFVLHEGSTWLALKDNLQGVEPAEGESWKFLARGFAAEILSLITAVDSAGLVGNAGAETDGQTLLDAIADKVANQLLEKKMMSNVQVNDATMVPTSALVYAMQQALTNLNSKTHELKHGSFTGTTDSNGNIYPQFEQNIHIISSIAVDRIAIPFLDGSWKTDFHIMNYDGTPASSLETTAYYWYFDA